MNAPSERVTIADAQAVLRGNDRGGYSVPTARLYPFQWNWDSAFVAMGWACFDEPRAWQEIHLLLRGQWEDGLIPQIVFHAPSDDYFPGPDVWQVRRTPPTSGITQPPVLATAVRHLLDRARDTALAEAQADEIYPHLLRNHRWWQQARDPGQSGLVATLHPWETGMDNSPAWDSAMARVPTTTKTTIRRRDTAHVDPAMRPRAEDYQRFIHLVDVFRGVGWQPASMLAASPFKVADIGTNAILLRAERDLLALAERFGTEVDRAAISAGIARMNAAIQRLWSPERSLFTSYDLIAGAPIPVGTSAGFLPLFGQAATDAQATALAATMADWARHVAWLVPSTDPSDPAFEPLRYWRGPIWAVVNWMIADGFTQAGHPGLSATIRAHTARLIDSGGLSEYFDPTNGSGVGGSDFSWTAAIFLLLHDSR
jgi:glycogen debranching enzyme